MIGFSQFLNKHNGAKAVVLGLGTSTNDVILEDLSGTVTIGVNDIGAVYQPKYLLTLDTPSRLDMSMGGTMKRSAAVIGTRADFLFAPDYIKEWEGADALKNRVVGLKLGNRHLANIDDDNVFDYSSNSPYVAVILAYRMGCRQIGIAGVDFTDDHCHAKDGVHELVRNGRLREIDSDYSKLVVALNKRGCELYNLSSVSMLASIPKMDVKEFLAK
jgi:hypothetical protein